MTMYHPSNNVLTVPNPTTSPSPPECLDTPNWFDIVGDGCDWYKEMEERCGIISEGDMGSALDNCCFCFNYDNARTIAPTEVDSKQPTTQPITYDYFPTPTPTSYSSMPTYVGYESSYGLCYTEMDCKDLLNSSDIFTEFVSGDYPFHGCFSSLTTPGILYWGSGTNEQIVSDFNELFIYNGEDGWKAEICV